MKKYVAVLVFLVLTPVLAIAQSITGAMTTQYVINNGAVLHDGPGIWIDATKKLGQGCSGSVWAYRSLDRSFTEIDYTLGCEFKYFGFSAAYFDLEPIWKPNDVFQVTGKFAVPKKVGNHEFSGYVVIDYIIAREERDKNSGEFLWIGLSDAWAIDPATTVNLNVSLLRDGGIFQGQIGYIFRAAAGIDVKHGKYTIGPLVFVSVPSVPNSDRETQVVAVYRVSR
jgi:hypothetical protein